MADELTAAQRGYGYRWQQLRVQQLNREPLCAECERSGRVRSATQVDHIKPKHKGGTDDPENLQSLCEPCHRRKTGMETSPDGPKTRGKAVAPVSLVCGPPGSGKTSFVRQRARWGDLRVDFDDIMACFSGLPVYEKPSALIPFAIAARDAVLDRLAGKSDVIRAYVIATMPRYKDRAAMAQRLGAETLILETPAVECLRRIQTDPRRSGKWKKWAALVDAWWTEYEPHDGERRIR